MGTVYENLHIRYGAIAEGGGTGTPRIWGPQDENLQTMEGGLGNLSLFPYMCQ